MRSSLLIVSLVLVLACNKEESSPKTCTQTIDPTVWTGLDQTQLTADVQYIDSYLTDHSLTGAVEDVSGLRYKITVAGSGDTPCLENRIKVNYTGVLMSNSNEFDKSVTPVSFSLKGVIAGWQIALLKFNRGTKATLYIPSGLAYGVAGKGPVPSNANLIFFVEIIDF